MKMDTLDKLAAEGAALESSAAPDDANGPQASAAIDPAARWAELPALFGSIVTMAMPELKPAYSQKNCDAWGAAMVPLALRHGWDVEVFLAWLGPHIAVAVATIPMAIPTIIAVKARRQAIRADRARQAQEAADKGKTPQPAPAGA